ncbi:MAG: PAS domain S-box protein, partial [Desulfatiglandales bacterium]
MAKRPTYRELEHRVKELESEAAEKKALEERLAACSAYLENTLASAHDGVLLLDEQERFSYVNPAFLNWLGREAEDFLGKTVQEVSPPFMSSETTTIIAQRAKRRVRTGEPLVGAEVDILDKDGKPMPVAYTAAGIRDEKGNIMGEVVFIRDMTEHKKMEEELKIKDAAIASSVSGVAINDLEGRFIYVNDSFVKMVGCESDRELLGKTPLDVALDRDKALKAMEVVRKEGSWSGELAVKRKDRSIFYAALTAHLVKDESGSPLCSMASFIDISKRKRAEEALRESENRYRELADLLPQTVFEIDERGNFTFANQYGFVSSGYTQEDIEKGLNALQLIVPEDRERVAQNIRKILAGERSQGYEYTALRKDGSTFPVLVYSSPIIRDNKAVGLRGIVIDMTERKKMEKALRESEEKYRGLFENASDAIFIADTKTDRILDANRKAERLLGRTRDKIIGMHQSELHIPRHAEYYQDRFRRQGQKGRVLALQAEVVRENGSVVPVFISASIVSINGEEVIQALLRDVTEEKRILD